MIILGIETSCDETACGVVRNGSEVLSSIVSSQIEAHAVFGGVVPEVAAREHLKNIDIVVSKALADARVALSDIDAIAVTQGPGLIGALLVGASYAKGIAAGLDTPLIPVDHVHAHIHGAMLGLDGQVEDLFPCLSLVVSGGHTNLYYMRDVTSFELMASSIDDACGESFDKVAKLLGLPYPGGPKIEELARSGRAEEFVMPKMVEQKDRLEFSYSGLKTHMVNAVRNLGSNIDPTIRANLCAAFQAEALGQIVRKIKTALESKKDVRSIVIAGGVSANQAFKTMMAKEIPVPARFPALQYCSDNGAMIAASGYYIYQTTQNKDHFAWKQSWDAYSRYQWV